MIDLRNGHRMSELACLLLFSLTSVAGRTAVQAQEPGQASVDASLHRLDILASGIDELRGEIDRSQFDTEAMLDRLDYEAEEILEFVRDEISFEAYAGLLRGAPGTLIARAGSALDQSVLAVTLLRNAGYEARIVRGTLNDADAQALVHQVSADRTQRKTFLDDAKAAAIFLAVATSTGIPEDQARAMISPPDDQVPLRETDEFREAEKTVAMLIEKLGSAWIDDPDKATGIHRQLVEEARDYFWVEYREGAGGAWRAAHVAHRSATLGSRINASEYLSNSIPENLQHRVRFSAFIEQKLGSQSVVHTIVGPYERPASNLALTPVELTIVPIEWFSQTTLTPEAIETAAAESTQFVVVFSTGSPTVTALFDKDGNYIDPMAGSSSAAGVVQTVGNRFGQAAGALDGESEPDQFVRLNRVWVEYELIGPGDSNESHSRTLYRWTGEAANAGIEDSVIQSLTWMAATGSVPPGLMLDRNLEKLHSLVPMVRLSVQQSSADEKIDVAALAPSFEEMKTQWIGHLQLFGLFDEGAGLYSSNAHSYRSGTNLIAYEESLDPANRQISIDVVSNTRRAFRLGQTSPQYDRELMVQVGVWETSVEGVLTRSQGKRSFNTFVALDEARAAGIDVVVLGPGDEEQLDQLEHSAEVIESVRTDIGRGNRLVIPHSLPQGSTRTGWWRIDQETGQTLGIGESGRGVEITQDMINRVVAATATTAMLCFAYMQFNEASIGATVVQCGKLALSVGGAVAAGVLFGAAAPMSANATLWAQAGIGGLVLNAFFEVVSLDPGQ